MSIEDDLKYEREYQWNKVFCVIVVFLALIGTCSVTFSMITENMKVSKEEYKDAMRMVVAASLQGKSITTEGYGHGLSIGKMTKKEYSQLKKAYEKKLEETATQ